MAVQIQSFKRVVPMIYAYNTPGVVYHDGWTKIGYTEKQTPAQRVKQQTHTADIRHVLAWQDNAMYKDGSGEYFTDREFHSFWNRLWESSARRGQSGSMWTAPPPTAILTSLPGGSLFQQMARS